MTVMANLKSLGEGLLAVPPWIPTTTPHRVTDATAELLTRVLGGSDGAQVEAVELSSGTSGTTDRRRLIVRWNERGTAAGLPTSVFVKSTPSALKNRVVSAVSGLGVTETSFYRSCRPTLQDVPAPWCYFAESGHGARHLVILEDITASGGIPGVLSRDCTLTFAESLMDAFAALHAQFWESPKFATDLSWVTPLSSRVGFRALAWQFRKMRTALSGRTGLDLPDEVHRMCEFVNAHDHDLYGRWEVGPQTLIHGDSHLGNTFETADGRAGLLDWQIVHRAPGMREVTYSLVWSLPVALRREHEGDLINRYLDGLAAHGVTKPPTNEEAWRDYRLFAFDAWDSIAFGVYLPGMQAESEVDAGFNRANAAVADLKVSDALADYVS